MITCKRCGKDKPPEDYYFHKGNKNGRMGVCKDCHNARCNELKRATRIPAEAHTPDHGPGMTLREIAATEGTSTERIRQIELRALRKIRKYLAENGFQQADFL